MFHLQFNGEGHPLYYREKASPFHNSYGICLSQPHFPHQLLLPIAPKYQSFKAT